MSIQFLNNPGCHERHLRRRHANPLFGTERSRVDQAMVDSARLLDERHEALIIKNFTDLIGQASRLDGEQMGDEIIELKRRLDQLIVECALFGNRHQSIIVSVERLIDTMITALRSIVADNQQLTELLGEEERARRTQHELLRYPLVADLIYEETPIDRSELAATLLSESDDALRAALWLFEPQQIDELSREAKEKSSTIRSPELLRDINHKIQLMERLE
jgi:hypothetical protein